MLNIIFYDCILTDSWGPCLKGSYCSELNFETGNSTI